MAFTTWYGLNVKFDASLVPEKQWKVEVLYKPTAAVTATTPGVTTGPLGATGDVDAVYVHGDGTSAGFDNPGDAIQKALVLVLGDRSVGN